MLEAGAGPDHARAVRLASGVTTCSTSLHAAAARESWRRRAVEPEMLEGMAIRCARRAARWPAVSCTRPASNAGILRAPSPYPVRRLDENTAEDNFLRRSSRCTRGTQLRVASAAASSRRSPAPSDVETAPRRRRSRRGAPSRRRNGFVNEPDTHFSRAVNRRWLDAALAALPHERERMTWSRRASAACTRPHRARRLRPLAPRRRPLSLPDARAERCSRCARKRPKWAVKRARAWPAEEREATLLRVADALRAARGEPSERWRSMLETAPVEARRSGLGGDRLC